MTEGMRRAFAAAGWNPEPSTDRERAVVASEARIGHRLPEALRQLLCLANGERFLAAMSNDDRPIPLGELGVPLSFWDEYDPVRDEGVLPFMLENQTVVVWAVPLDEGDDPRVLVASSDDQAWERCCDSFTEWLDCQVFDWTLEPMFEAQAEPVSEALLARLGERFREGTRTYTWPASVNHRFSSSSDRLLLMAGAEQSDWWIGKTSRPFELLDELSALGAPVAELYGVGKGDETEERDAMLRRWRLARDLGALPPDAASGRARRR